MSCEGCKLREQPKALNKAITEGRIYAEQENKPVAIIKTDEGYSYMDAFEAYTKNFIVCSVVSGHNSIAPG